jgi:hypothetical protein
MNVNAIAASPRFPVPAPRFEPTDPNGTTPVEGEPTDPNRTAIADAEPTDPNRAGPAGDPSTASAGGSRVSYIA